MTFTYYDSRGRVYLLGHMDILPSGSGVVQQRLDYTHDNVGNVLSYKNTTNRYGTWDTTYGYDRANRLLRETRTGGVAVTNFDIAYAYDKNNNRTGVTRNGAYSAYTRAANDRLLSGDSYTFAGYDNDGNPGNITFPNGSALGLTYNDRNQLRQLNYSTGGTNTLFYNGDGKRVERNDNTGTTRYVYDLGGNVIAETNAARTVTRCHTPGMAITEANGARYYYRENALGSQVMLTGAVNEAPGAGDNGNQITATEYDGYGSEYALSQPSPKQRNFRFAGKHGYVTDLQSGMQLLGARYYLPALGRFLTQDPIGHQGGLNLYAYADNNPLSNVDPDGLQGKKSHSLGGVPLAPPGVDIRRKIKQAADYRANTKSVY